VWLCFLCVWVRAEGVDKRQERKRDKRQGWQKGSQKVLSLLMPLLALSS